MESKKNVLLIGAADWAGSCFRTVQAINRVGKIEAHHITLFNHPNKYDYEVMMPLLNAPKATIENWMNLPTWEEARKLVDNADLIHCWNNEGEDFAAWTHGLFDIPLDKVRSYTFTGTGYRNEHTWVNERMKNRPGHKVVVAHPTLRYPHEFDSEFIPHPIDVYLYTPLSVEKRNPYTIGHYCPPHANTTVRQDVEILKYFLKQDHPDWKLPSMPAVSHKENLERISKCMFYFEYMDQNLGYWGTSTLEAAAMGVPVFTAYTPKCRELSMGRVGDRPGIISLSPANIQNRLNHILKFNGDDYQQLVKDTLNWVKRYHSYETVGKLYTEFFKGLL